MMNKSSYLKELEKELVDLNADDRQNVLAYYDEYLIDAASEGQTDAETILGSPHTLAAQIRADIAMAPISQGRGAATDAYSSTSSSDATYAASSTYPGNTGANVTQGQSGQKKASGIGAVWTVVLAILAIPIGLPLAIALFFLIIAVLLVAFSVLLALASTALGVFVGGLAVFVVGLIVLFMEPPVGLFYIGSGLLMLGVSVLFGIGVWKLSQLTWHGVAKLFNAIRKRISEKERAKR